MLSSNDDILLINVDLDKIPNTSYFSKPSPNDPEIPIVGILYFFPNLAIAAGALL